MKNNFYKNIEKKFPIAEKLKNKTKKDKCIIALLSLAFIFALVAIIVVGFVFCYVISVKYGKTVIDLDEYNFSQDRTSIVYAQKDNNWVEIARLHGEKNRIWIDYEDMPKNLYNAFIALEDKRFHKHNGVDWVRTIGVMVKGFNQGGSTITQQLIKNLTDENDVTFVRKFNEITYALNMERKYDKVKIMESYLNTIPLGSGCYGVQTAAETYFGKDASELNLAECAVLASITKAPTYYNPFLNPDNNKTRQEECLGYMLEQKLITKEKYDEAVNYELVFTNSESYTGPKPDSTKTTVAESEIQSFYVDFVIDCAIADLMEEFDYDEREATNLIYYGGLKIYSAVDLEIQEIMEDVYENRTTFPKEEDTKTKPAVQSAMTIMDYNGRVVGIVGAAGKKTANRALNMAADLPRQPGSSIKPLSVYAPAIEKNLITWSTLIENYPIMVNGRLWPQNYGGNIGSKDSYKTVQYALQESLNTIPAQIINKRMNLTTSFNFLKNNFHISTLTESDLKSYSAMAVGGMNEGLTTLEVTAAYAVFGNGGKYYEPYCYTKITSYDGEPLIVKEPEKTCKQALSSDTANVMCKLLQTVITSGTGNGYSVNKFSTFAKTGTTTNNYDRWFAGGTPYYVASVWYGYKENRSITNVSGNPAGKIFKEIMNRVHKNLEAKDFDILDGIVQKSYCRNTGNLAGSNCTSTGMGWYKKSHLPSTCTSCSAVEETTNVIETTTTTAPITSTTNPIIIEPEPEPTTTIQLTQAPLID